MNRSAIKIVFITVLVLLFVLASGCSFLPHSKSTSPSSSGNRTQAAPMASIKGAGINATDPILHRWVRIIPGTTPPTGYEYRFYPDGKAVYNAGLTRTDAGNILVQEPYAVHAAGTWTKADEDTYVVKVVPEGSAKTQIVTEYTLVPAHPYPANPSVIIAAHIESAEETRAIHNGKTKTAGGMNYPEQAKND